MDAISSDSAIHSVRLSPSAEILKKNSAFPDLGVSLHLIGGSCFEKQPLNTIGVEL